MMFDESKLLAVWKKYENYLKMIAEVQLGNWLNARVGASDILQESMFEATRDLSKFRGQTEAELFAWLKAILFNNVNRAVDFHVSAQKRSVRREVALERLQAMHQSSQAIEEALVSQFPNPSSEINQHEMLIAIADAVATLKDEHRQVVMLRTIEGKSYCEIAEIMNRNESACRMMWVRSIEDLKKQFAAKGLL